VKLTAEELALVPALDECTAWLAPLEYNVLVAMARDPKKKGSLYIPETVAEKEGMGHQLARVVATSPLAWRFEDDAGRYAPKLGAIVVIGKYAGKDFEAEDGLRYRVLKDRDIAGILAHPSIANQSEDKSETTIVKYARGPTVMDWRGVENDLVTATTGSAG
jgi:co-chaperonin GroES (HSP10)